MLEKLMIFAVLLAVQSAAPHNLTGHNIDGNGNGKNEPPAPISTVNPSLAGPNAQNGTYEVKGNSNPQSVKVVELPHVTVKRDAIDLWKLIFSGLLVIVGAVAGWLAWKTVNATSDAAKAALDSVKAVINAERAWIVIQVESPAPNTFHFKAVNVGKTPAKVISIHGRWVPVNRHSELHLPPDDEMNVSLIGTPPCFLPPTVSCTAFECNITDAHGKVSVEEWMNHLRMGLLEVFFYGKIRYYDVLDGNPKILHETKWLYWLLPFENALPIPDPKRVEYNTWS